jgi:hypothetical protein
LQREAASCGDAERAEEAAEEDSWLVVMTAIRDNGCP